MESLFRWSASHPLAATAVSLLPCVLLSAGMAFLRVDGSLEQFVSDRDPVMAGLRDVRENYGDRPRLFILAESPDLFERDTLLALRDLAREVATVPGVVGGAHLFNMRVPVPGGGHGTRPLLPDIPTSREDLDALKERILSHELVRDHLVNARGEAMLLVVFLEPESPGGPRHDTILEGILEILRTSPAAGIEGLTLTPFGVPVVTRALHEILLRDLAVLGPAALLVLCATIFAFYRSLPAVILPAVTGIPSVLATLGFMGWAGFELNILLATVPVIILVLGCTEDLHIVSEYLDNLRNGRGRPGSIALTGSSLGRAMLLTAGTTVLSFLGIAFTSFDALRDFAVTCAFGLTVNFLVTIVAAPAFLAWCPDPPSLRSPVPGFLTGLGRWLERGLRRHPGVMVLAASAWLAVSLSGLPGMTTDTDHRRFFRPDSEISRSFDRFQEAFGGVTHLIVTLETGRRNGFADPDRFRDLGKLRGFLAREIGTPLDLATLLNEARRAEGTSPEGLASEPTAAELERFLHRLPREVERPFLDYDGSRAAIHLFARGDSGKTRGLLEIERRIESFARSELDPSVTVRVTGEALVVAHLCDLLVGRLVQNLVPLAAVTALLIALLTGSARQGILSLVPNLFPVATVFGAMGWLGIPINITTFPVAIIAFGIAVDDTIHLIARFNLVRRGGLPPREAAFTALRTELRPVVATSAAVALGYFAMSLSPLRTHAEVGLLFALAALGGCLGDLVLTPLLLRRFDGARGAPAPDPPPP